MVIECISSNASEEKYKDSIGLLSLPFSDYNISSYDSAYFSPVFMEEENEKLFFIKNDYKNMYGYNDKPSSMCLNFEDIQACDPYLILGAIPLMNTSQQIQKVKEEKVKKEYEEEIPPLEKVNSDLFPSSLPSSYSASRTNKRDYHLFRFKLWCVKKHERSPGHTKYKSRKKIADNKGRDSCGRFIKKKKKAACISENKKPGFFNIDVELKLVKSEFIKEEKKNI